jgi:hypothetical protein
MFRTNKFRLCSSYITVWRQSFAFLKQSHGFDRPIGGIFLFSDAKACPRQQRRIETSATVADMPPILRGTAMRLNGFALVLVSGLALSSCGGGKERPATDLAASQVTTIGVNSYLWRASLDALSFMPLVQTDSAGGVIVTDWYVNPNTPGERMKLTVSILDQDLRADALRVAAAREVNQNGQWVSAPTRAATVQKLEGIILTKARDLRRSAIAN